MKAPSLQKHRPVQTSVGRFLSAEWKVCGYPGLFLRRAYNPSGPIGSCCWEFTLHRFSGEGHSLLDQHTNGIYLNLQEQKFRTRREALQALAVFIEVTDETK